MPGVRVDDIVALVGGRYDGPRDRLIRGAATLQDATSDHISFLGNPLYAPQLRTTKAGAVLVPNETDGSDPRFIRVSNPHAALAKVVARWFDIPAVPRGISPLASISPTASATRRSIDAEI